MLNKIVFLSAVLMAGASFADELGIPYALSCSGNSSLPGVKITLNTQHGEEGLDIVRSLRRSNGSPISAAVSFAVQSIGPKGDSFQVKSLGRVAFAGGGSLIGVLNLNEETKLGTWTETHT